MADELHLPIVTAVASVRYWDTILYDEISVSFTSFSTGCNQLLVKSSLITVRLTLHD